MSHATHLNGWRETSYKWMRDSIWMLTARRREQGYLAFKHLQMRDITHSHVRRDLFTRVTWPIHTCDMAHSHVRHGSFTRATWLIHTCDVTRLHVRHDSFTRATWPIHKCDMNNSHVRHDSFICVTWLIHISGMTHSYTMTHSHARHDSFTNRHQRGYLAFKRLHVYVNKSCFTYRWLMPHIWMRHVPQINAGLYMNANSTLPPSEGLPRVQAPTHMGHESCLTYKCVITYEWVISNMWKSHVTRMN